MFCCFITEIWAMKAEMDAGSAATSVVGEYIGIAISDWG